MGEYSLTPVGKELNPMQKLSSEALKENGFLKTLPPENQEIVLQTLSILGTYTITICDGKWNSYRWRDAWKDLMKVTKPLINSAISITGRPTIESGYENLFQMLDTGVETMEDLRRVASINGLRQIDPIKVSRVVNRRINDARRHR